MPVTDDVRLPSNQAAFDAALMNEFARSHEVIGPLILEQFRCADVTDRYGSRVGCFTHFRVPDDCSLLPADVRSPLSGPDFRLRGITSKYAAGLEGSGFGLAGSLLFHERGKISMLECYAYGESWPEDSYEFEFPPTKSH